MHGRFLFFAYECFASFAMFNSWAFGPEGDLVEAPRSSNIYRKRGFPLQKKMIPLLAVLYAAGFISAFNENIINVVLVDVMGAFSVSSTTAQWLVTGYMIVTATVVSVMAFLTRRFTLRTLIFSGAASLIVGSVGCFFAPSFALLLLFRLVQAVGTGIFIPVMMTTVLMVAPRQKLGTYLSIGSCCITFGPALSPVVSGLFATMFGWRYVFVTPALVILVIALFGWFAVKNLAPVEKAKLDVPSVLFSALGLVGLAYGLTELASNPVVSLGALVVGAVFVAAFVMRQRSLDDPILDLRPFRQRRFVLGCLLAIVAMMTTFSMSVVLVLYFEAALGATALVAGAVLLIPILINAGTAVIGGRIMDKRGAWPLLPLGFAIIVFGQAAIALASYEAAFVAVVVGAVVTYGGVGLVFSPSQTAGLSAVDREQHASGVSIMNLFVQVAACLGPALFVGVMSSVSSAETASGLALPLAEAHGFSATMWVACGVAFVGVVVSLVLVRFEYRVKESQLDLRTSLASRGGASIVDDVMQRDVVTVDSSADVSQAIALIVETSTGGVPVVDANKRAVGYLSDGDIVRFLTGGEPRTPLSAIDALAQALRDGDVTSDVEGLLSRNVMDIARGDVVSVASGTSLDAACRVLADKRVRKMPVVEGDRVVGTISRSDVMRSFLSSRLA